MNKCNSETHDLNPKTNRCCKKCMNGLTRHPHNFTRCIKGNKKILGFSPTKKLISQRKRSIKKKTDYKHQDATMFKDIFPNLLRNTTQRKNIIHHFVLKNPPFGINNEITISGKSYNFDTFINLIWKIIDELGTTISNTKTHSLIMTWNANKQIKTELSFSAMFQSSNNIELNKSSKNSLLIDTINGFITIIHNKKSFTKKI
jgi:hypothetical protein